MSDSPLKQLASILLGDDGPVERFINERRAQGVAWRKVTRELYEATDRKIDISHETAREWVSGEGVKAAS